MSTLQNVQTTSTTTSSSTVRPRATRLISGLSEANELNEHDVSTTSTPFDSRSASPIPSAHPQRSTSRQPTAGVTSAPKFAGSSWGRRAQLAAQKYVPNASAESPTLAGMWGTSWSTLQGLASEFLGAEEEEPVKEGLRRSQKKKRQQQQQTPFQKWYNSTSSLTLSPASASASREWGPPRATSPATTSVGTGTKQEREAALRAQKRKDMLLRQDSSYADALGKFKRRLSDDYSSSSVPPRSGAADGEEEGLPALVYIHHVQKDDTMAGISLKYNCSANVVRKANRMWANDTPQSRQTLVIPVDACAVKGRPVADPSSPSVDLLSSEIVASPSTMMEEEQDPITPKAAPPPLTNGNSRTRASSVSTDAPEKEEAWHHDSWVQLPNFAKPTEIARLSRRALGYFPPARRKSETFSDQNTRGNTPSASLDIPRSDPAAVRAEESSRSPQRPRRQHQRRLSNASNGYFPSYLSGPGGVGTMNKNVRCPGPAQDGLNKIFAKHLPDVAPPKNQIDLYHPDLPLTTYSDDFTPSVSGIATPTGGAGGGSMGLENVGGAIESWVRKLATKATTPSASQAKARAARASVGKSGRGGGGIGDLIEMTDEFELGVETDEEEEFERGRQKGNGGYLSQSDQSGQSSGLGGGSAGGGGGGGSQSSSWWKGGKGD